MNARQKGLNFCKEVTKILQGCNHVVDGPFFKSKWFNGKVNPVHCDIFNCFDLCSYYQGNYFFHQVSTLDNKASKVKTLQDNKLPGWIWVRVSNGKVFYRIFDVQTDGKVLESEIRWKI